MHPAGRALIGFWVAIVLLAGAGALVLAELGPPRPRAVRIVAPSVSPSGPPARIALVQRQPQMPTIGPRAAAPVAASPPPVQDRGIPPPDPALLEPAADFPDRRLPIVGPDGRMPGQVYAGRAGLPAHGPQVAILLEGIGLSDAVDQQAVETLAPAISFAVSPYSEAFLRPGDDPLLDQARRAGHETWLSLPMEPAGSPLDNEGPQALSLSVDLAEDHKLLEWSLSRFGGYVGVTNALAGLRGDRFASAGAFSMVAEQIGRRGLLYVDAGLAPHALPAIDPPRTRHADLTIDEEVDAADIEARLGRLEQIAQTQGSALGIAGPLRPVTIERLRAWSHGLAERGLTLVPVSALPAPRTPAAKPATSPP